MVMVYHGTILGKGLSIAEDGFILSNWDITIKSLKEIFNECSNRSCEDEYGKTLEELAFEMQSGVFGDHEIKARVECLTVTTNFDSAAGYAKKWNSYNGGICLGIELDDEYFKSLMQHAYTDTIRFVPRKLSLDNLKEVHMSPVAKLCEEIIKEKFRRYSPQYFKL